MIEASADLGIDPHQVADRHAAELFHCWRYTSWTPDDLTTMVQAVFDRDVAALAWLVGATEPHDVRAVRERYAIAFASAWGMLRAQAVLQ